MVGTAGSGRGSPANPPHHYFFFKPARPPSLPHGGVCSRPPHPLSRIRPPFSFSGKTQDRALRRKLHRNLWPGTSKGIPLTHLCGGGSAGDLPTRKFSVRNPAMIRICRLPHHGNPLPEESFPMAIGIDPLPYRPCPCPGLFARSSVMGYLCCHLSSPPGT